jgi:hypothetical protein
MRMSTQKNALCVAAVNGICAHASAPVLQSKRTAGSNLDAGVSLFTAGPRQTGFLPFPAPDGEFQPFEVNLGVPPWIVEDHGLNSGIRALRTYNSRNSQECDIINHGSRYPDFEGGVGKGIGQI